jgi:hypothetical protein
MAKYQRKTTDEYELVYDYGYGDGHEVLSTYATLSEAKKGKQEYIENEGISPAIKHSRVKKEGQ